MGDPKEKQKRHDRIKIRKSWTRNPGTQVHKDSRPKKEDEDIEQQIQEGMDELEDGL